MSQKSYNGTPTLFLVPTPIGNLEDITLRAINVLQSVEIILAEDTRVTGKLLKELKIKKPLLAAHDYNEEEVKEKALKYLLEGNNIALVSDRGTPIISDPGYKAVKYIINNGYNVVSLPGPTAFVPALTSSGLKPMPFLFYGFLDSKMSKQKKELEEVKRLNYTMLFYEAPHRLIKTLKNMEEVLGNRQISISREISKKFEEVYRGTINEVRKQLENVKGELVIVVAGNEQRLSYDHLTIMEHINMHLKEGKNEKEAIKMVAKERKLLKNEIYQEYHRK